jgi:hypothetical protein
MISPRNDHAHDSTSILRVGARVMAMTENDPWTSLCETSDKMRPNIRAVDS